MQPIEIKTNNFRHIFWVVILAPVFLLGIYLLLTGVVGGLVPLLFGGIIGGIHLYYALDKKPRITLDQSGVTDRTLGVGTIEWNDIISANIFRVNNQPSICLKLRDPQKYRQHLGTLRRGMSAVDKVFGMGDINLNVAGTDKSPETILALMSQYQTAYSSAGANRYV